MRHLSSRSGIDARGNRCGTNHPWAKNWQARCLGFVSPLVAVVLAGGWSLVAQADPVGPTAADRQVTLAVSGLLPRGHLTRHPLDDEISQRCLKNFVEVLDPMKLYFNQSDVDGFLQRQSDLDDLARRGDIGFAYNVFQVFLKRIDERVGMAEAALAMEHDFTVNEEMVIDRDTAQYARTDDEARELWRKRVKYDILMQKVEKKTLEEAREKLGRRYRSFAKRMHQTDRDELLEMYLTSLTTSYDPHTSYMAPSTLENFDIVMRLQLEGIGAALESEDGYTKINQVVPGGPADKDGRLKPGDRVIGVGQGADGEFEDVVDMKLSDVVKRIRGKRGTVVRLQVIPEGQQAPVDYAITRDAIELKDGEAHAEVFDVGQRPDGQPYKVGVIDLPSFYMDMEGARQQRDDYKSTTRDVLKILDQFRADGVNAVVMDLRRNGGGSLTEAIHLTGLFIDQGPIVQVKGFDGEVQHYDDLEPGTAWDGPLVVLISKLSASASEIFAGAVQDYGRGLVIGDKATHGKGTVQTLRELGPELFQGRNPPAMGALKITMQQFYRPNGDSTQNRGVLADLELPSLTTHWDIGEQDLDYPIPFDQVEPASYRKVNLVDRTLVGQLAELSSRRVQASPDFKKVLDKIAKYREQKERKTISLNEATFLAERAELNAEKDQEDTLRAMDNPSGTKILRDYYLDEAMAITVDFLRLIQVAQNN